MYTTEPTPREYDRPHQLRIQEMLQNIVTHDDFAGLLDLQEIYCDTRVRVDDATGHFPDGEYPVTAIRTEVRKSTGKGFGIIRFYLQSEGRDAHHPGRQFTLRTNNIDAISVMHEGARED